MREEKFQEKKTRSRTYSFVVHPDTAPDNWIEILNSMHVPALISPLHNKDVLDDGALEKAHYHVLLSFTSLKSWKQVEEICSALEGRKIDIVHCPRTFTRFFVHMDQPQKFQYNIADIISLGGAKINLNH